MAPWLLLLRQAWLLLLVLLLLRLLWLQLVLLLLLVSQLLLSLPLLHGAPSAQLQLSCCCMLCWVCCTRPLQASKATRLFQNS
jgi:hypothetical protein